MILLGNILFGLAQILSMVITIAIILIIARAVISWVNADQSNPIVRFLVASTDPMMLPFRRRLPLTAGGVDFTPIVVLLVLYFVQYAVVGSLEQYGNQFRFAPPAPVAQ